MSLAARPLTTLLRLLPLRLQASVAENFRVVADVDYPHKKVRLSINSSIEYAVRRQSCAKEPETVAWLEESLRPGDTLFDVGANVGVYSLLAAAQPVPCRVYSFEPSFTNFMQLSSNILLNGFADRVSPFPVALTDSTKLVSFFFANLIAGAAMHSIGEESAPGQFLHVIAYRADDFVRAFSVPTPTHLKLDVDGAELAVLRGAPVILASKTLRTILIESGQDNHDAVAARSLLAANGFRVKSVHSHGGPIAEVANYIYVRDR